MTEKGPQSISGWLLYGALWPFSCLYAVVAWARTLLYDIGFFKPYHAAVPVVSVGNITVGGTGKTPVVDSLVKYLTSQGKKVAIISRGYRGAYAGKCGRVTPSGDGDILSAVESGDEPFLLASRNPGVDVYVARKRRHGVAAAEANGAECIVLDDAFQHLAVARDVDIVLLDGRAPFGNGSLLPAGNLREVPRAINRANLIVLTHAGANTLHLKNDIDMVMCQNYLADCLVDLDNRPVPWSQIEGKRCLAFAGIARPDDFFNKLRERDCVLAEAISFADHQEYNDDVITRIKHASENVEYILTTEKDMVKLLGHTFPVPCLAVPLELMFDNFEVVESTLNRIFGENHD